MEKIESGSNPITSSLLQSFMNIITGLACISSPHFLGSRKYHIRSRKTFLRIPSQLALIPVTAWIAETIFRVDETINHVFAFESKELCLMKSWKFCSLWRSQCTAYGRFTDLFALSAGRRFGRIQPVNARTAMIPIVNALPIFKTSPQACP